MVGRSPACVTLGHHRGRRHQGDDGQAPLEGQQGLEKAGVTQAVTLPHHKGRGIRLREPLDDPGLDAPGHSIGSREHSPPPPQLDAAGVPDMRNRPFLQAQGHGKEGLKQGCLPDPRLPDDVEQALGTHLK